VFISAPPESQGHTSGGNLTYITLVITRTIEEKGMRPLNGDAESLGVALSVVEALNAVNEGHLAGDGVHWSLDGGWDLNVNLAHLDPGSTAAANINDVLDVAIFVLHGSGRVCIDGATHPLTPHTLAAVARGTERSLHAGDLGLTYITVHDRRGPLSIAAKRASRE
jgi:hypothetical protein